MAKVEEYQQMMAWLTRPKSKFQEPRIMDQASLTDDLEPGSLKDELLKDFDPSQETYEEYLRRKSLGERPFNMAEGGRMSFYKGMSADKAPKKIKLKDPNVFKPIGYKKDGTPKYDTKAIRELDPNFKGKFEGPGLKKSVPVYQDSKKFADITEEAIRIRNAIILENGNIANLETLGDLADIKSRGKTNTKRTRDALAIAVDNFPEIANFKFITERFKNIEDKSVRSLNMIVDAIKASQKSVAANKLNEKLIHFLPDNIGFFYKAPGKATDIGRLLEKDEKPLRGNIAGKRKTYSTSLTNKMYELNNDEIKYITDRITEETGKPFTSKDYNNLVDEVKDLRSGVGQAARIAKINEKTYGEIVDLANDDIIQNLLKGDLDRNTQTELLDRATKLVDGDISTASRRLFQMAEAMSDTTDEYKNLGIKLNNNKADKIIATGKQLGGTSNRYAMSGVVYDYYGNVVDKALKATEGESFIGKYQTQIRNLLDKGQSPDEIFSLTASARRGLSPYAIFTQQLRTEVNSAIKGAYIDGALSRTHKKLQAIFKGRKYNQLNAKDKKAVNDLVETFEKTKADALKKPINPTAVKNGAKPIYLTAAEKKNIKLPEFDLKNPPSKSIANYASYGKNLQKAFDTSYKNVGYSMKVPKEYLTQKQMIADLTQGVSKFGSKGRIASGILAAVLGYKGEDILKGTGLMDKEYELTASASDAPIVEKGLSTGEKIAAGTAAAGTFGTKTGRKILGRSLNLALGPMGAAGLTYAWRPEGGYNLRRAGDRITFEAEAALAPTLVKGAQSVTEKIKNPLLRKGLEYASGIRLPGGIGPATMLRAARVASPIGLLSLAGEGIYHAGKKEMAKRAQMSQKELDAYMLERRSRGWSRMKKAFGGIMSLKKKW